MTVRVFEIESELANEALSQQLADAGFIVSPNRTELGKACVRTQTAKLVQLSALVTNFVFSNWVCKYVEGRVATLHPYLSDDEHEYVCLLTCHLLQKEEDPIGGEVPRVWQEQVRAAITSILTQHRTVSIDGVMRFRARAYLTALDEAVHQVVEQFLTDREYEEFVSMLRFLLDSQPETAQVLHVFCLDERVWISDATGEMVRDSEVLAAAYQASDDGEVDAEDLAMSILITRSPASIIIHDLMTNAPWPSFAETVERVFLGRVSRCADCTACAQLQEQSDMQTFDKRFRKD